MKHLLTTRLAATLLVSAAPLLSAAGTPQPAAKTTAIAATDPATTPSEASAAEGYPLTTCVVSGEPLDAGHAGGFFDYIHKDPGKPDRLVRFCCRACIKEFKKDTAKYLAKIDAATAALGKGQGGAPVAGN
jgi:hypothetical protein